MNNKLLLLALAEALTIVAGKLADGDHGVTVNDAAPTTTAAVTGPAELDAEGLPWDDRIHASTKTKTQAGTWTKKKGVDDTVRDAVVGELRKTYPAPVAAAPTAPVAPAAPVTAPVVPAAPVAPPVVAVSTPYTELLNFIAKNTGEGKYITEHWINDFLTKNGDTLAGLAADLDRAAIYLAQMRQTLAAGGFTEVV